MDTDSGEKDPPLPKRSSEPYSKKYSFIPFLPSRGIFCFRKNHPNSTVGCSREFHFGFAERFRLNVLSEIRSFALLGFIIINWTALQLSNYTTNFSDALDTGFCQIINIIDFFFLNKMKNFLDPVVISQNIPFSPGDDDDFGFFRGFFYIQSLLYPPFVSVPFSKSKPCFEIDSFILFESVSRTT